MLRPKIFPTLWKTWVAYGVPHGFVRHDKILRIQPPNLKKKAFPAKPIFFKMPTLPCISTRTQPLAATCSHSQPLAATRVAASGCKWLLQASGRKWPQVAASGRKWPLQASGRKWPQVAAPDSSQRVAASGRKWPLPASGRKWPQVAASGRKWPQVAASGRKWQFQASGRKWPQVAAFCDFNFHPQSMQPPCNVFPKKPSLLIFRSAAATESTIIVEAPSRMVIFRACKSPNLMGTSLMASAVSTRSHVQWHDFGPGNLLQLTKSLGFCQGQRSWRLHHRSSHQATCHQQTCCAHHWNCRNQLRHCWRSFGVSAQSFFGSSRGLLWRWKFPSQTISPWSMLRHLCWKLVSPLSAGKVLTAAAGWSFPLAGNVLTATGGPSSTSESSLGTDWNRR